MGTWTTLCSFCKTLVIRMILVKCWPLIPISSLGPFGLVSEFSFHRMQSVQKLASSYSAKNLDSKPWYALDGCLYIGLDSHRFCLYLQSIEFWKAGLPINYYSHLVPSPTIPILSWFLNVSHAFSKRFSTMESVSARPHNIFTMAPKVAEWCFNLLTCRLFAACTAACANHNKMIKMTPHDDQKGGVWILYNAF